MKRAFYIFVLPIVWISVSFVSYFYPGDEYGIYVISNIIGVWPFFIFQPEIYSLLTPAIVACVGGFIMVIVGFGMDKLRVHRRFWCGAWGVFTILLFIFAISQYPSIQKALSKNGSWTAYIAGAMNMGLYLSVVISVLFKIIVSLIGRFKQRKVINHISVTQ